MLAGIRTRDLRKIYTSPPPLAAGGTFAFSTARGKGNRPPKPQIVTIENGLTVAQDGTGQYETIQAALDNIKPGQTIRVLDAAVYRESVSIGSRSRHAGLKSARRAGSRKQSSSIL